MSIFHLFIFFLFSLYYSVITRCLCFLSPCNRTVMRLRKRKKKIDKSVFRVTEKSDRVIRLLTPAFVIFIIKPAQRVTQTGSAAIERTARWRRPDNKFSIMVLLLLIMFGKWISNFNVVKRKFFSLGKQKVLRFPIYQSSESNNHFYGFFAVLRSSMHMEILHVYT